MYDPGIGRWLEQDPSGIGAGDSNLYRYVGNRPTDSSDPSGLQVEPINPYGNPYDTQGYGMPWPDGAANALNAMHSGSPSTSVLGPGGETSTSAVLQAEHYLQNLNPYGPYRPSPYSPNSPEPNQGLGVTLRGANIPLGSLLSGLLGAGPGNAGALTFGTCVGSNCWGTFWISQSPLNQMPQYNDQTTIRFAPNPAVVDATQILFIQIAMTVSAQGMVIYINNSLRARRDRASDFTLDRGPDEDFAWYGLGNGNAGMETGKGSIGNTNTNAVLDDDPGSNRPATFRFETFAIAMAGNQKGQVYGGVSWGFSGDANGVITQGTPAFLSQMTPEFIRCCTNWNRQAVGRLLPKNSVNQEVIGTTLKNP